jgi:copper chaperone CopZ
MTACPRCGASGRAIKAETIEAQVPLETIGDGANWALCLSVDCNVAYFHGAETVPSGQLAAVPFHKGTDPGRLVCFCFEHSVADVEADVAANGRSTIRESIKAACKAGDDDCLHKNPQGRCCLGNVGQVIESAAPRSEHPSCCAARSPAPPPPKQTTVASLFAPALVLIASALSSACCWLPLAAIGLGVSSGGVGAVFLAWRVPLLLLSVATLALGFYLVYRKPRCPPNPRLQRLNRRLLWFTTALVAAFALFPEYISAFTGGGGLSVEATAQQTSVQYRVDGMTCSGCEAHAREAIEATNGVSSAAVSFSDGTAVVVWNRVPDHRAVSAALVPLGYRARPRSE